MSNPFFKKHERLVGLLRQRKQTGPDAPTEGTGRDGKYFSCKGCKAVFEHKKWLGMYFVCPMCGHHHPLHAGERLTLTMDGGIYTELPHPDVADDPLEFPGYSAKKAAIQGSIGLAEAVLCATGEIGGCTAVVAVMDGRFLMGSMGSYVGEAITRAVEHAQAKQLPLIIFSASGGARMQEGIFSLMQMAKTAAAIEAFCRSDGLYISVLTHPTTGGVYASFASLGDITLAEPGALIGFAGPRVIEQTIRQQLPEGFQRSEYLLEHGFVDSVLPRSEVKAALVQLLRLHGLRGVHSERGDGGAKGA